MAKTFIDTIQLRAEIFREGDQYVAICPELNVSSFGDTAKDAKESLKEAVGLFLEECHRMGTLKAVLEEAGFSHRIRPTHRWLPPTPIGIQRLTLSVAHG